MSALTDLTQTSGTSTTTLPDWYNAAQTNVLNAANTAAAAAPTLGQTTAQGAINTLSGPNNPFTSASNTLGSIATGAANPWITDPNTGAVTPNTSTAMGGLFQAQNQAFNQLLPTTLAPSNAGAIGSGNFGSLRGQTAVDTTAANALSQLQAQQMQAALQNQQTGVGAAANQGNVANLGITNAMNVGQEQMTAPYTNAANYGNILASLTAPQTIATTQTPSGLQSITGLGTAVAGGLNALLPSTTLDKNGNPITNPGLYASLFGSGTKGAAGYTPGLFSNLFNSSSSNTTQPVTPGGSPSPTDPSGNIPAPVDVPPAPDPNANPTPVVDPTDPTIG